MSVKKQEQEVDAETLTFATNTNTFSAYVEEDGNYRVMVAEELTKISLKIDSLQTTINLYFS